VLGRYSGAGHAAIKVTGNIGKEEKEFVYELKFLEKTGDEKNFVEDLWARRKVGYLLDQIRANGEKKELVDEVTALAKRYGITTPYTSYLIVPDAPVPVARAGSGQKAPDGKPDVSFHLLTPGPGGVPPPALQNGASKAPTPVLDFIQKTQKKEGEGATARFGLADKDLARVPTGDAKGNAVVKNLQEARDRWNAYNLAYANAKGGRFEANQAGKLGVDLSCETANLRCQSRLTPTATRWIGSRNCLEVGGVWIDEAYNAQMKTVNIKAQSKAYFRLLERQPSVRDVLRIGNHLVWVTPSGTALVVDTHNGVEDISDADIDHLFALAQKK
jgi:Ca-activated chloride channel family protein